MTPPAPIRVLFVINSLTGGGAERVFSTLVEALNQTADGMAITVALLDDVEVEAYSMPSDIMVERLNCAGSLTRSTIRLRGLVRRLKPDVSVSFLSRANVATVVSMYRSGRPAVISERVNTTAHLRSSRCGPFSRILIRLCYPRAHCIIAVSKGVATTLAQDFALDRKRIRVICNPVDVAGIRSRAAEAPAIDVAPADFVTMGRLVPNKNTAMAIRAFAASRNAGRLIVLGEGPLGTDLKTLAASLGVADRVVFAGFLANPHAILARACGYLLTSNAEGFPNAMVEAMAAGLPAIATDCPSGPAEILEADLDDADFVVGRGGALVAMNDHAAMAACMDKFADPALRSRLAEDAIGRVSDLSVERATRSFHETILDAVASREVPRP